MPENDRRLSMQRTATLLNCGFMSGLIQAFLFNPWDRALYLSVKYERPFLRWNNFHHPFDGVTQTVVQRAISSGLYFPLEEIFADVFGAHSAKNEKDKAWKLFLAGTLSGAINGVVMNPLTRIKYHFWGKSQSEGIQFFRTAKEIYTQGGIRHFFIGSNATVQRDLIFGGIFALLRHQILPNILPNENGQKKAGFTINIIAGSIATILSSPLNYVRNVHYATPPSQEPEAAMKILKDLLEGAYKEKTLFGSISYVQSRLRLGWGTARVGCGMAFGAYLYESLVALATSKLSID